MKDRFRKYLPVVVDLETGGFDPLSNAVLEIAITMVEEEEDILVVGETFRFSRYNIWFTRAIGA